MSRYQKYHLKWPWTPRQVENLDEMLGEVFTDLDNLEQATTAAIAAAVPTTSSSSTSTIPGPDGQDGDEAQQWPLFAPSTAQSFTPGSIPFAGASGTLTEDNANLFFDDTNNRLGVGTASPAKTVDVLAPTDVSMRLRSGTNNDPVSLELNALTNPIGKLDYNGISNDVALRVLQSNGRLALYTGGSTDMHVRVDTDGRTRFGRGAESASTGPIGTVAIGTAQANGSNAPLTLTTVNAHLNIGFQDWLPSGYNFISFGFVDTFTYPPTLIGFQNDPGVPGVSSGFNRGDLIFGTRASTSDVVPDIRMRVRSNGTVCLHETAGTGILHLPAGTATAGTAPIKLEAGTLLTTPELGALEFTDNGTTGHLYITLNVAGVLTRVQIV